MIGDEDWYDVERCEQWAQALDPVYAIVGDRAHDQNERGCTSHAFSEVDKQALENGFYRFRGTAVVRPGLERNLGLQDGFRLHVSLEQHFDAEHEASDVVALDPELAERGHRRKTALPLLPHQVCDVLGERGAS